MRKKFFISILVMCCVYGIINCNNSAKAQDKDYYEVNIVKSVNLTQANDYVKEGNYDKALEIYNSILEKNPESIPARLGVATIYSDLYKIKASQREFKAVLAQDPDNSEAHNGLGMNYYRITTSSNMDIRDNIGSLYRQAAEEFSKAIASNPNNDEALANLGMIYQHQGRIEEAEVKYKESLTNNPMNSNANYRLGTILFDRGDTPSAIEHYKKSLQINSKNSSAHYYLGEALIADGKYSEAIESLQTSLYLNPNSAPVYEKLGEAYKHQGNETAAIESFKKSIAIKPEDTLAYLLLSSVYEDRGDGELAIAELKSALENNPDFSEAKLKIANMSLNLGKVDQSIEYYKQSLIDDPGNPKAERGLSKAYFKKVQSDVASGIIASPARLLEAEKYVNKAISNDPDDLELYYAKFKLEKMSNKPEPTTAELDEMVQIVPMNVPQALTKGYGQFRLGDFRQSDQTFRGVVNQVTDEKDKLLLAETLIEFKNYDIAEEVFKSVMVKDADNVQAKRGIENISKKREDALESYRLGWDLYKKGQRKSAVDQFKKSQVTNPVFEKSYYWAAETLKKDDQFASACENYKTFLALTENINVENADPDLMKRRNHAVKMLQKLSNKANKN